jgi:hypothetical protein
MRAALILILCALIVGCGKEGVIEPEQVSSFDQAKFAEEFGALFLADAPLHYDDAHSFLSWFDHEVPMSETDKQVVCSKLKQFLQRKTPRKLDLSAGLTGVAPPEAVLRAYAVRLLGKLGNLQDVPFLKGLTTLDQTAIPKGLRYPSWKNRCTDAIKSIEERNR